MRLKGWLLISGCFGCTTLRTREVGDATENGGQKCGLFATRRLQRPNAIGLIEVDRVEHDVLYLRGVDDGYIKPPHIDKPMLSRRSSAISQR